MPAEMTALVGLLASGITWTLALGDLVLGSTLLYLSAAPGCSGWACLSWSPAG